MENRNNSYFINMRKFHNSIKKELYNKYANGISNLLEIAVGKGGDLSKWNSNNIKHIVGYDIDNDSITEAKRRVNEYNRKKDMKIELYTLDLSNNEIPEAKEKFDVVSAQFSFHYFFKTKETFETVMKSIDNNIRRGGYFIGTLFDGKSIKKISNVELKDKNQVKFKLSDIKSSSNGSPFGNEVTVEINDTVLTTPTTEYIVDFEMFKKLMKEHGYDLIESNMFQTLLNPSSQQRNELNDIQKSVSFLNRTFVFKRTFCEDRIDNILSWCPLKEDILKYNQKLLYKYKKELFEKFKESKNEKYLFIIKNFENIPNFKNHSDFNYMNKIYEMYKKDLM